MLHQKHESSKYVLLLKNCVDWITTKREENVTNTKMAHFEKYIEIKKKKNPLITTFYNFTLKIETSWAKKNLKPILKTWNANDIIYMISRIKWKIYRCNVEKNNSKCTKFIMKY